MPRIAPPSTIAAVSHFDSMPLRIDHAPSRLLAIVMLALLLLMACMIIVPVGLVLSYAAQDVWDALVQKPLAGAVLALGLLAWTVLFLVPAYRIAQRSWQRRSVSITRERVVVRDAGLLGSRLWTAPLAEFRGVAHHVRATLTGVRHELILVHRAPNRSLLLHTEPSISQPTIDRAAALFSLPQLPAQELYRLTRRGRISAIEPLREAPAA